MYVSKKLSGKGEANAKPTAHASLRLKHAMSSQHFRAATFFADKAEELETKIHLGNQANDSEKSQHRAYVVGSIVSAVMSLEACINEIYQDAVDGNKNELKGLSEQGKSLLAEWYPRLEEQRAAILLKYRHALLLVGKPGLPKGENPYQDADYLIYLRNQLTHFKPEWDDSLNKHGRLKTRLAGKFNLNPLSTKNALWFPHQCLGSGCARWGVVTAQNLVSSFCSALGIVSRIPPDLDS